MYVCMYVYMYVCDLCIYVYTVYVDYVPALEGRAIVNLQMGNLFGSFLDISKAIKVWYMQMY